MELPFDDNLNPDNDYMYTVTTCRCLVVQTLCKLSSFQLICRWKKAVIGHSARTLRAYFAIMVAQRELSRIAGTSSGRELKA